MLLFIASACPLTISAMGKLFKVVGSRALKIQQKFHVLFVDRIVVGEIPVFWLICLTETSFSSSKKRNVCPLQFTQSARKNHAWKVNFANVLD